MLRRCVVKNSSKRSGKFVFNLGPFSGKGAERKPNVCAPVAKSRCIPSGGSQRDLYQENQESRKHSNNRSCEMVFFSFFSVRGGVCCAVPEHGRSTEVCCSEKIPKTRASSRPHWLVCPGFRKAPKRQCLSRENDQIREPAPKNPIDCVIGADDETAKGKRSRKQRSQGGPRAFWLAWAISRVSDPLSAPSHLLSSIRKGSANLGEK